MAANVDVQIGIFRHQVMARRHLPPATFLHDKSLLFDLSTTSLSFLPSTSSCLERSILSMTMIHHDPDSVDVEIPHTAGIAGSHEPTPPPIRIVSMNAVSTTCAVGGVRWEPATDWTFRSRVWSLPCRESVCTRTQ